MTTYLEFEKPIAELESKISELRHVPNSGDVDIAGVTAILQRHGFDGWYVLEQDTILTGAPEDTGVDPVADVRAICDEVGATLLFDAAHSPPGRRREVVAHQAFQHEPERPPAREAVERCSQVALAARRGPDSPAATQPPKVALPPKRGGSNPSIWPLSRITASISASGVPARTATPVPTLPISLTDEIATMPADTRS